MMLGLTKKPEVFNILYNNARFRCSFSCYPKGYVNLVADMMVKELTPEQVFMLNDLISNATAYSINGIDIVITEGTTENYVGGPRCCSPYPRDMENINVVFAFFRMVTGFILSHEAGFPRWTKPNYPLLAGGGGHKEAASSTVK